jgi:ammonium transporter, Amt family
LIYIANGRGYLRSHPTDEVFMPPLLLAAADRLDVLWLVVCSAMVFSMQGGFCCLESGLVRAKNSINVAAKNILDFCISSGIFWTVGYGLAYGTTRGGVFGTDGFFFNQSHDAYSTAYFLFQLVFCGTSVTIISGAVAERTRLLGYVWIVLVTALLIYPAVSHWIWNRNGIPEGPYTGWLAVRGFVDFAGSTVVHSVGGWISLAAILAIGPRLGRYDQGPRPLQGHDVPMAALGVVILWFGWYGFNGGSALRLSDQVPMILVNTTMGAAMGGCSASLITWTLRNKIDVGMLMNGILAGLVSVTASCHATTPSSAVVIGLVGGAICVGATSLMNHWKIDDAVGAVPVHLGGGIWGTLSVAIFGELNQLGTGLTRLEQVGAQLLGIAACFGWAFLVPMTLFWITRNRLRVDPPDEHRGLNIAEHDATTEMHELLFEMERHRVTGDFSQHVPVEPHTEVGQIAQQYNRVLDAFGDQSRQTEQHARTSEALRAQAEKARGELASQVETLDRFHKLTVGREERMVELKREINELCRRLGQPPPYPQSNGAGVP